MARMQLHPRSLARRHAMVAVVRTGRAGLWRRRAQAATAAWLATLQGWSYLPRLHCRALTAVHSMVYVRACPSASLRLRRALAVSLQRRYTPACSAYFSLAMGWLQSPRVRLRSFGLELAAWALASMPPWGV